MFKTFWLVIGVAVLLTVAAGAATPLIKRQVPGYYRMSLGALEVTALYDGYNDLAPSLLHGASPDEIAALLRYGHVDTRRIQTAFNAFAVNTGSLLILFDTGAGTCIGETAGSLPDNLRAAGYQPEQIDHIFITHLHLDHACGLIDAKGQAVFPHATVHLAKAEADYWLDPAHLAAAPDEAKPYFEIAARAMAPYLQAGQVQTFDPGSTLLGMVETLDLHGHTPGSSGYRLRSGGQSLVVAGDVIHVMAVQMPHPEITIAFDTAPDDARATRLALFADAAESNTWIAAAHLPFPAIGHLARGDGAAPAYLWQPVPYGPYQRAAHVPLIQ